MPFESFLQYLQYEKNYSLHTVEAYENDLQQFKEFFCGEEPLDPQAVDAVIVRRWLVFLMGEGYSPRSVNRKLSSLKSFFRYLSKYNKVESNPVKRLVGPKTNKPIPYFINDKEMAKLFLELETENSFEDERDKVLLDVFYSTGIRCAELIGLKDEDIDFGAQLIRVTGKRNKQRLVPFSTLLKENLQAYLSVRNEQIENPDKRAFFVRKNGQPLSKTIVYTIVKRRLSDVPNLSKRSPHVLRHTFATSMLNHGADLNAVKELLGHASLSSTEVYTHTTFEELKKTYHQAHPRA
ncbi:tyrosine recombinase XerC [Bacteroidia bacterium]|nr:tyrosine recombinase XerC [Bacteroidia bacterium]